MRLKTLLITVGLGAGMMYFFDPQQGGRRRAQIENQINKWISDLDTSIDTGKRDLRNRTRGLLSEMTARLSDQVAPDWILEERVRSNFGRISNNTRAVDVRADGGYIYLTGPALREDRDAILKAAARTRGVYGVEDELQLLDNPQDIPSLQANTSVSRQTSSESQQNWSPATRLLGSVGGSLLTLYGMRRSGLSKPLLSTAGLIITARSMTNMDTRSLLGVGENLIKVRKAITIDAPIDEVYQFWRNFENFKLFMNHVKEITVNGDVSTWQVAGPAGSTVEFQSHITRDIPNESIAWESMPDSQVKTAGFVRFDQIRDGSTRVSVQMEYLPPAGVLGHAVAQLFGVDPRQAMNDDLMRLKSRLETGKTSSSKGTAELGSEESRE
ncbi:MAG: SRPBCC family protein [Bacteroidota bacterium]